MRIDRPYMSDTRDAAEVSGYVLLWIGRTRQKRGITADSVFFFFLSFYFSPLSFQRKLSS